MTKQQTGGSTGTFHMENFRRRSRYVAVFAALAAALFAILVLNINTGTTNIPVSRILRIIFLRDGAQTEYNIIWKIRMPRLLMAAILGGALSLSGFLLQTFFENPIAGPYLLGISSGAKMVVALAMIYFLEKFNKVSSYTLVIAAFIGSLIATGFILLVSRRIKHMATLLCDHGFCDHFRGGFRYYQSSRMVTGKFLRYELEQCKSCIRDHRCSSDFDLFAFQTYRSISAGRSLCTEHGCKYQSIPCDTDPAVQYSFCDCHSICRTDLLRGNRSASPGKAGAEHFQAAGSHTWNFPWGSSILYAQ